MDESFDVYDFVKPINNLSKSSKTQKLPNSKVLKPNIPCDNVFQTRTHLIQGRSNNQTTSREKTITKQNNSDMHMPNNGTNEKLHPRRRRNSLFESKKISNSTCSLDHHNEVKYPNNRDNHAIQVKNKIKTNSKHNIFGKHNSDFLLTYPNTDSNRTLLDLQSSLNSPHSLLESKNVSGYSKSLNMNFEAIKRDKYSNRSGFKRSHASFPNHKIKPYLPINIDDICYDMDRLNTHDSSNSSCSTNISKATYDWASKHTKEGSHTMLPFKDMESLSIHYIKNISKKRNTELIRLFNSEKKHFIHFFKSPMRLDHIPFVLDFVLRLCTIDQDFSKMDILQTVLSSKEFIQNVSVFVEKIVDQSRTDSEIIKNMSTVVSFIKEVSNYVPNESLMNFNNLLLKTLDTMNDIGDIPHDLIKVIQSCKNKLFQKIELLQEELITYNSLSIFPSKDDLLNENMDISPSIVKGPYNNVVHYIDVQFKLLKEDYLSGLRGGINLYLKSLKEKNKVKNLDIFVYNVTYSGLNQDDNPSKKVLQIFEVDNKNLQHVDWDSSRRLIHGSLLFFSCDNFETLFMGVLDDRKCFPEKNKKSVLRNEWVITVEMVGKRTKLRKNTKFVMLESRVFYEPYFQVMNTLKGLNSQTFPMKKYIVDADVKPEPPKYLIKNAVYIIGQKEVSLNNLDSWPEPETLGLNKSQIEALHAALTREFVVIQGPPGTGKTHLGIKLISTLLDNKNLWSDGGKSSIFIVCFRNNAVDQILNALKADNRNLVRLGGRSSSEVLKDNTLKNTIGSIRPDSNMLQIMNNLKDELKEIKHRISELEQLKLFVLEKQGVLHFSVFTKMMTPSQQNYFSSSVNAFWNWLLEDDDESDLNDEHYLDNPIVKSIKRSKGVLSPNHTFVFLSVEKLVSELEDMYFSIQSLYDSDMPTHQLNNLMTQALLRYREMCFILKKVLNRLSMCHSNISPAEFSSVSDLESLTCSERWALYDYWANEFLNFCEKSIDQLIDDHDAKLIDYLTKRDLKDGENLRNAKVDVIGATTTGAARLNKLLEVAKPKIVLIEEAAEVLEAHAITSLTEHCEHLILIGDHKQLKPSPASHTSAVKYHMDVSLFERMINNGMDCFSLTVQHRMRPEISSLVVPLIYPSLTNHESVEKYPDLKGVTKNLFFLDHREPEDILRDNDSHQNKYEAHLALAIAEHMMKQGYEKEQITILTVYTAQLLYMLSIRKKYPLLENVDINVVDNFQGEENDIIILSLVRSNSPTIGFLSKENRICVALTRARMGFIMVGNMETLQINSSVWKNMKKTLEAQSALGEYLTLRCEAHRRITRVKTREDFLPLKNGGCADNCDTNLDCGHKCPFMCHAMDQDHTKQYSCKQPCLKISNCGIHQCKAICSIECPLCDEELPEILICGHDGFKVCAGEVLPCKTRCDTKLKCGHQCPLRCHYNEQNHTEVVCTAICNKPIESCPYQHKCTKMCTEECGECDFDTAIILECGHTQVGVCRLVRDMKCEILVEKQLICGHSVKGPCSTPPSKITCTEVENVKLPCEHYASALCGMSIEDIICDKLVKRDLLCGHTYENAPCSTPVDELKCSKEVTKTLECGHSASIECHASKLPAQCTEPCTEVLKCGHKCSGFCNENCPPCNYKMENKDVCGHFRQVKCCQDISQMNFAEIVSLDRTDDCNHRCGEVLPCNHSCMGTCGKCMQGRVHTACNAICRQQLICGHYCTSECSSDIHSCKEKCMNACKHLNCNRPCGEMCQKCNVTCEWACKHYRCEKKCWEPCSRPQCEFPCELTLDCGHPCCGFCGEPCPPVCTICSPDKVAEDRYILLEECDHVVSQTYVSKWVKTSVGVFHCPKCNTPIVKTNFLRTYSKTFFFNYSKIHKNVLKTHNNKTSILDDFMKNLKILSKILNNKYEDCKSLNQLLHNLLKRTTSIMMNKKCEENRSSLKTLLFLCFYITEALKLSKVNEVTEENNFLLLKRINHLASYLLSRESDKIMSEAEMRMFFQELIRLTCIIDLVILMQEHHINPESTENILFKGAMSSAFSFKEFSLNRQNKLTKCLQELKKEALTNYQLLSVKGDEFKKIRDFFVKYHQLSYHRDYWIKCDNEHSYYSLSADKVCPICSKKKTFLAF